MNVLSQGYEACYDSFFWVVLPTRLGFRLVSLATRLGFRLVSLEIIESRITSQPGSINDESDGKIYAITAWEKCPLNEKFIILYLR